MGGLMTTLGFARSLYPVKQTPYAVYGVSSMPRPHLYSSYQNPILGILIISVASPRSRTYLGTLETRSQLGGSGGQVTMYYGERGSIMYTLKVFSRMDQIVGGHATMCTLFMCACWV